MKMRPIVCACMQKPKSRALNAKKLLFFVPGIVLAGVNTVIFGQRYTIVFGCHAFPFVAFEAKRGFELRFGNC